MTEPRPPGPGRDPEPELAEFASRTPLPLSDPAFRDALRAELWELLLRLLARFRR